MEYALFLMLYKSRLIVHFDFGNFDLRLFYLNERVMRFSECLFYGLSCVSRCFFRLRLNRYFRSDFVALQRGLFFCAIIRDNHDGNSIVGTIVDDSDLKISVTTNVDRAYTQTWLTASIYDS